MDTKALIILIFSILILAIDLYVFQAVRVVSSHLSPLSKKIIYMLYWALSLFSLISLIAYASSFEKSRGLKNAFAALFFINYTAKIFAVVFLLIDDLGRLLKWLSHFRDSSPRDTGRSEFLMKTALIAGSIPLAAMSWGVISGAHDYRIRRKTLYLAHLPTTFDGIRVAQISDIHSGSFYNKTAVRGGVDLLMNEKADIVFFTGDLVNNEAKEMNDYVSVFEKIKAPLGVYSVLGNHDYGDYRSWKDKKSKEKNLQELIHTHRLLGWNLLMDENVTLTLDKEQIGILGVQNWGTGRFAKYGDLAKAYKGTENLPVKLLLSHDPSHWDAQINASYQDIDVTFSGHTHGMQFGIEIGDFKWSPVQYRYPQWADLYQKSNQYLYVNRGFGFIGFPGRVGILPEITIIELKSGSAENNKIKSI